VNPESQYLILTPKFLVPDP